MHFFTLLQGECWALKRNRRIHLLMIMMLGMAAINRGAADFFPVLSITTAYTGVWMLTISSLIEEKQRRTLEALLLTPARPLEILAAKAATGVLLSTLLTLGILLLFWKAPGAPSVLLVGFLLCVVFAAATGLLIGILSPDMQSSSLYRVTALALLIGGTVYPWHEQAGNSALAAAMRWTPLRPVEELIWGGWTGTPVPVLQNSLVLLAYILALLAIDARILRQQATNR